MLRMGQEVITKRAPALAAVVPNPELRVWLESGADEPRELIIEVKLPPRQVAVTHRAPGHARAVHIVSVAEERREESMRQLADFVASVSGQEPALLKAAGALALRTSGKEAQQIARHELVKAIRPNRHLR